MKGEKITAGDVVRLKSGGPKMTVKSNSDDGVLCIWFVKEKMKRLRFEHTSLTIVEKDNC